MARQMIPLFSKMQPFTLPFSANENGFPILYILCLVVSCLTDSCSNRHFTDRNSGKIPLEACDRKQERDTTIAWWRHHCLGARQHHAMDHCAEVVPQGLFLSTASAWQTCIWGGTEPRWDAWFTRRDSPALLALSLRSTRISTLTHFYRFQVQC